MMIGMSLSIVTTSDFACGVGYGFFEHKVLEGLSIRLSQELFRQAGSQLLRAFGKRGLCIISALCGCM